MKGFKDAAVTKGYRHRFRVTSTRAVQKFVAETSDFVATGKVAVWIDGVRVQPRVARCINRGRRKIHWSGLCGYSGVIIATGSSSKQVDPPSSSSRTDRNFYELQYPDRLLSHFRESLPKKYFVLLAEPVGSLVRTGC